MQQQHFNIPSHKAGSFFKKTFLKRLFSSRVNLRRLKSQQPRNSEDPVDEIEATVAENQKEDDPEFNEGLKIPSPVTSDTPSLVNECNEQNALTIEKLSTSAPGNPPESTGPEVAGKLEKDIQTSHIPRNSDIQSTVSISETRLPTTRTEDREIVDPLSENRDNVVSFEDLITVDLNSWKTSNPTTSTPKPVPPITKPQGIPRNSSVRQSLPDHLKISNQTMLGLSRAQSQNINPSYTAGPSAIPITPVRSPLIHKTQTATTTDTNVPRNHRQKQSTQESHQVGRDPYFQPHNPYYGPCGLYPTAVPFLPLGYYPIITVPFQNYCSCCCSHNSQSANQLPLHSANFSQYPTQEDERRHHYPMSTVYPQMPQSQVGQRYSHQSNHIVLPQMNTSIPSGTITQHFRNNNSFSGGQAVIPPRPATRLMSQVQVRPSKNTAPQRMEIPRSSTHSISTGVCSTIALTPPTTTVSNVLQKKSDPNIVQVLANKEASSLGFDPMRTTSNPIFSACTQTDNSIAKSIGTSYSPRFDRIGSLSERNHDVHSTNSKSKAYNVGKITKLNPMLVNLLLTSEEDTNSSAYSTQSRMPINSLSKRAIQNPSEDLTFENSIVALPDAHGYLNADEMEVEIIDEICPVKTISVTEMPGELSAGESLLSPELSPSPKGVSPTPTASIFLNAPSTLRKLYNSIPTLTNLKDGTTDDSILTLRYEILEDPVSESSISESIEQIEDYISSGSVDILQQLTHTDTTGRECQMDVGGNISLGCGPFDHTYSIASVSDPRNEEINSLTNAGLQLWDDLIETELGTASTVLVDRSNKVPMPLNVSNDSSVKVTYSPSSGTMNSTDGDETSLANTCTTVHTIISPDFLLTWGSGSEEQGHNSSDNLESNERLVVDGQLIPFRGLGKEPEIDVSISNAALRGLDHHLFSKFISDAKSQPALKKVRKIPKASSTAETNYGDLKTCIVRLERNGTPVKMKAVVEDLKNTEKLGKTQSSKGSDLYSRVKLKGRSDPNRMSKHTTFDTCKDSSPQTMKPNGHKTSQVKKIRMKSKPDTQSRKTPQNHVHSDEPKKRPCSTLDSKSDNSKTESVDKVKRNSAQKKLRTLTTLGSNSTLKESLPICTVMKSRSTTTSKTLLKPDETNQMKILQASETLGLISLKKSNPMEKHTATGIKAPTESETLRKLKMLEAWERYKGGASTSDRRNEAFSQSEKDEKKRSGTMGINRNEQNNGKYGTNQHVKKSTPEFKKKAVELNWNSQAKTKPKQAAKDPKRPQKRLPEPTLPIRKHEAIKNGIVKIRPSKASKPEDNQCLKQQCITPNETIQELLPPKETKRTDPQQTPMVPLVNNFNEESDDILNLFPEDDDLLKWDASETETILMPTKNRCKTNRLFKFK